MSTKEALPKAAFQYGVKMAEGRKTGKKVGSEWSVIGKGSVIITILI